MWKRICLRFEMGTVFQNGTGCFVIRSISSPISATRSGHGQFPGLLSLIDDDVPTVAIKAPSPFLPTSPNPDSSPPLPSPLYITTTFMRSGPDARGSSILKSMPPEEVQVKRSRGELSCAECRRPVSSTAPPSVPIADLALAFRCRIRCDRKVCCVSPLLNSRLIVHPRRFRVDRVYEEGVSRSVSFCSSSHPSTLQPLNVLYHRSQR